MTHRIRRAGSVLVLASALLVACDRPAPSQAPPLAPPPSADPSGGACDEPTTDASIVLFDLDGVCLSGDTMVLYRCSPAEVPVLRVASDDGVESFVGGLFAVPVSSVPANIRFIGRGDGTEVLVSDPLAGMPTSPSPTASGSPSPLPSPPDVAPLVYVRHDGVTERWLRLERGRSVADPPSAWLIGDSILDGGRDAVSESLGGWTLTIDAEVGRSSSQGVPLAAVAAEQGADVVLVELGTNDATAGEFRGPLVETLDLLRDTPLVLWQTARAPEELTTIAAVNESIREIVPRYPNTAIVDWEVFAPEDQLMEDGIHPREGSEGLEAELLTPILESWRGAVSGEGATSCAKRVVRASS